MTICAVGAAFEARQRRIQESRRPRAERLADIRKDAAFMVRSLQELLDRTYAIEHPESRAWMPAVIDLYRRLEALAASPSPSHDNCLKLAAEASSHVKQQRLKGVCVGILAHRLAAIVNESDGVQTRNVE
jgi:hypothetical protein